MASKEGAKIHILGDAMTKWNYEINITELHNAFRNGAIKAEEVGKAISKLLKSSPYYSEAFTEFVLIVTDFEDMDRLDTADDYHIILQQLYDFADENSRIWIETKIAPSAGISIALKNKLRKFNIHEAGMTKEVINSLEGMDEFEQNEWLELISRDGDPGIISNP